MAAVFEHVGQPLQILTRPKDHLAHVRHEVVAHLREPHRFRDVVDEHDDELLVDAPDDQFEPVGARDGAGFQVLLSIHRFGQRETFRCGGGDLQRRLAAVLAYFAHGVEHARTTITSSLTMPRR